MHNSQDGAAMGEATAQNYLLMETCLGCHTGTDGSTAINTTTNAPAVDHTSGAPTAYLAGGSFYYVADGDEHVHNVQEIGNPDSPLVDTPPGQAAALANSLGCVTSSSTTGCHTGGGHHANIGGDFSTGPNDVAYVNGSSVGASFRFLSGVRGGEKGNWEFSGNTDTSHNVYFASVVYNNTATDTITSVCEACHGGFHGANALAFTDGGVNGTGTSPWIRHPTDISLYGRAAEHLSYGTYSMIAPIASDELDTAGYANGATFTVNMTKYDALDATNLDIVTCVSCHRAHGSPYNDLLRWSYATMTAGTGVNQGCMKCHTTK
jgi:hypothetical protein